MLTLTELLIIWIATIIISYGMQLSMALNIFKFFVDNGYKIDANKMNQITNNLPEEIQKNNLLTNLTPGYNIIKNIERYMQIVNQSHLLIDQFRVMGILEEMTVEEKEEYLKKPTTLNAILVMVKSDIPTTCTIKFDDENKITYVVGENLYDIKSIKSVIGPISQLSEEEQKKKIIEKLDKIKTSESKKEELNSNTQQTNNKLQKINERKQKLENLKQEIISQSTKEQKNKSSKKILFRKKEK